MTNRAGDWSVVGASGFVGSAIFKVLSQANPNVRGLKAPRLQWTESIPPTVASVESKFGAEIKQLAGELRNTELLINAAGLAKPDGKDDGSLIGANSVLPIVLHISARRAKVRRFIHLSSAAVQGDAPMLDETARTAPNSPYARSKALAEEMMLELDARTRSELESVILRATSVQGEGRPTTRQLIKYARSPFAVVAAPGTQPTVVSTSEQLARFVLFLSQYADTLPQIVLQPNEGLSVRDVIVKYGGREPVLVPAPVLRAVVKGGYLAERVLTGRRTGRVRRIEVAWFGQSQVHGWARDVGYERIMSEDKPETGD